MWVLSPGSNPPVRVYKPNGRFTRAWGTGLLDTPHQIKLDRQGNVWLADSGKHVVLRCTAEGKSDPALSARAVRRVATSAISTGPLTWSSRSEGDVFVADGYGNSPRRPLRQERHFRQVMGQTWHGTGRIQPAPRHRPWIPKVGLYVADRNNVRIQVFDQDGSFHDQWRNIVVPCAFWMTTRTTTSGSAVRPPCSCKREDDKVLGYPPVNQLFMKFNTSGKLLQLWSVPLGEDGARSGRAIWNWEAHGLALDSKGNIYAVDIKGKRAQKFVPQDFRP